MAVVPKLCAKALRLLHYTAFTRVLLLLSLIWFKLDVSSTFLSAACSVCEECWLATDEAPRTTIRKLPERLMEGGCSGCPSDLLRRETRPLDQLDGGPARVHTVW